MAQTFYQNNSQFLKVSGLKDQSTSPATYVNDATLTATLNDSTGTPVPGAQNMAGIYQAGSNGEYHFLVDPTTFNPTAGSGYTLVVNGNAASGARFHAELVAVIKVRTKGTET